MSFFDRLKSNLIGSDAATTDVAPGDEGKVGGGRFMGKDELLAMRRAERAAPIKPIERGFEGPGQVWIFVCPNTQRLLEVPNLGASQGEVLTYKMLDDLRRIGICEEVSYHAGYDQYWKMPSQDAIFRMPGQHGVEVLPMKRIQMSTQLVKAGEARGFWMRVRLREASELPQSDVSADSQFV